MKALKVIGIILVVIIGGVLITALFVSKDFSHEESLSINAPINEVWESTNTLRKMDAWSPWTKLDPDIEQSFSGEPGAVNSKNCWDSQNENVGAGCQTITKVEAPHLLESKLEFTRPMESTGEAYLKLEETPGGTEVTWGIKSEMAYPMNILNLIMSAEESMGPSFVEGLESLKAIVEN